MRSGAACAKGRSTAVATLWPVSIRHRDRRGETGI